MREQAKVAYEESQQLKSKFLSLFGSIMCGDLSRDGNRIAQDNKAREKALDANRLKPQVSQVESPISEREWRKLVGMYNTIEDFDPMNVLGRDKIHASIVAGIPDYLRGEIWCILCNCKQEKSYHSEGLYSKLIDMENPEEEHRIQKDVVRTFTNYPMITEATDESSASWKTKTAENMLSNILLAYANYDTQVGYVQGLNYIAAMLLMHI